MISPETEKWDLHFTISQGAKTPSLSWHTTVSVRKHLISLCNWKNYQDIRVTLTILGNGTFILLYSKVPNPSAWSDISLDTIQAATIWSLEMGNIKGLWEKLIESEKKSQNITKTQVILRNGSPILPYEEVLKYRTHSETQITIENHQIGSRNWKAVQNYENNQGYVARA